MTETQAIRIGSRASKLATTQCELLANSLKASCGLETEIVTFSTAGDRKRDYGSAVSRDKLDWVEDIQKALINAEIDCALHSGKDVPVEVSPQTLLIPVLKRATPNDALIYHRDLVKPIKGLSDLEQGARVGTSSLRRAAQLKRKRADLEIIPLRGNVPTRISKLHQEKQFDAIVIAAAGIERLQIEEPNLIYLPLDSFVPGVNQGILLAQVLKSNTAMIDKLSKITDEHTSLCSKLERIVVEGLEADCHSALGVFATKLDCGGIKLLSEVFSKDGSNSIRACVEANETEQVDLATELLSKLKAKGAQELLLGNIEN